MRARKGFTLIELVVVIAVLGILAAIGIPRMVESFKISRGHRMIADLRLLDSAIGYYIALHGEPPESLTVLTQEPQIIAAVPEKLSADFIVKQNSGVEKEYTGAESWNYGINPETNRAYYGGSGQENQNIEFYLFGESSGGSGGTGGGGMGGIAQVAPTILSQYVAEFGKNPSSFLSNAQEGEWGYASAEDKAKLFAELGGLDLSDATLWAYGAPNGPIFTWTSADPSKGVKHENGKYNIIPVITYGSNVSDYGKIYNGNELNTSSENIKYRVYVATMSNGGIAAGMNNPDGKTVNDPYRADGSQNRNYVGYECNSYEEAVARYNTLLEAYNNGTLTVQSGAPPKS